MVTVGVDITARHAAEQALVASEQRLRRAQQVAGIGAWELDLQSGRLEWSDGTFSIFERDPSRAVDTYEAFLATVHPEDRALVDTAYMNSLVSRANGWRNAASPNSMRRESRCARSAPCRT